MSAPSTSFRGRIGSAAAALVRPAPVKKYTPHQFLNIASAFVIVGVLLFSWVSANWNLSFDPQKVKCLPYFLYIQAKGDPGMIERGKIYTYKARGLKPIVPDGTTMGKIAAGVPGDRVLVNDRGIFINGEFFGPLNDYVITKVKLAREDLFKEYVIPDGKYLMLGTLPRSYDGRYWGLVDHKQLAGRAYPVW